MLKILKEAYTVIIVTADFGIALFMHIHDIAMSVVFSLAIKPLPLIFCVWDTQPVFKLSNPLACVQLIFDWFQLVTPQGILCLHVLNSVEHL